VPRKCNPLCPHFRCTKRVKRISKIGRRITVICAWTGDPCIGYKCRYAICEKHALMPNGTCALTISVKAREKSIEQEAEELEKDFAKIKDKLKRIGGLDKYE